MPRRTRRPHRRAPHRSLRRMGPDVHPTRTVRRTVRPSIHRHARTRNDHPTSITSGSFSPRGAARRSASTQPPVRGRSVRSHTQGTDSTSWTVAVDRIRPRFGRAVRRAHGCQSSFGPEGRRRSTPFGGFGWISRRSFPEMNRSSSASARSGWRGGSEATLRADFLGFFMQARVGPADCPPTPCVTPSRTTPPAATISSIPFTRRWAARVD